MKEGEEDKIGWVPFPSQTDTHQEKTTGLTKLKLHQHHDIAQREKERERDQTGPDQTLTYFKQFISSIGWAVHQRFKGILGVLIKFYFVNDQTGFYIMYKLHFHDSFDKHKHYYRFNKYIYTYIIILIKKKK